MWLECALYNLKQPHEKAECAHTGMDDFSVHMNLSFINLHKPLRILPTKGAENPVKPGLEEKRGKPC